MTIYVKYEWEFNIGDGFLLLFSIYPVVMITRELATTSTPVTINIYKCRAHRYSNPHPWWHSSTGWCKFLGCAQFYQQYCTNQACQCQLKLHNLKRVNNQTCPSILSILQTPIWLMQPQWQGSPHLPRCPCQMRLCSHSSQTRQS